MIRSMSDLGKGQSAVVSYQVIFAIAGMPCRLSARGSYAAGHEPVPPSAAKRVGGCYIYPCYRFYTCKCVIWEISIHPDGTQMGPRGRKAQNTGAKVQFY